MTLNHLSFSALSAEQLANLTCLSRITSSQIHHIACSLDGTLLAVASPMGVTFYDASSLTPLWNYAVPASFICFSQDHPISIIASGNEVHVVHAIDKQVFHVLKAEEPSISRLAVSQASDLLAVLYGQRTVKIWSLSDLDEHASYTGETESIHGLAFHPGGQVLALSTREGVRLWDLNEGTSTLWPVEQMRYVKSLFFDPDGTTLLATGQRKMEYDTEEEEDDDEAEWELIFWQVHMLDQEGGNHERRDFQLVWGGTLAQLETRPDYAQDPRTKRYELIGSGDGRWLAVVEAPTVSLWSKSETRWEVCRTYDALSFDLLITYGSHTVVGVAFAARGTHLVVAYDTEGVVVYDAFDAEHVIAEKRLGNHSWATAVAFHPDENLLAVGDSNGVGRTFRLRDTMQLYEVFPPFTPDGHWSYNTIDSLVFHPEGTCIAAYRHGDNGPGRAFVWRTADGTLLSELEVEGEEELCRSCSPIAFVGNADLLVTTSTRGSLTVTRRRISDGKVLQTFPLAVPSPGSSESLRGSWVSCQLSPDRTLLFIKYGWYSPSDIYCTLWRMQDGENLGTFEQTQMMDWYATTAISPDNRWLAMTTRTESIGIWDMESRQLTRLLTPDTRLDEERRLLFTADSSLLIVREDYQVSFWRVNDGQRLWTIKTGKDTAARWGHLAVRNDGRLLALIEDGAVSLWGFHSDVLALPETPTNSDRSVQTLFDDDQRKIHQQEALPLDFSAPDHAPTNADHSLQPDDDHEKTSQQAALHQGPALDSHALDPLLEALSHPRRSVSVAAAHALGTLGTPQALEALLTCLQDRRGAVRAAAARSLRWFRDPRIVESLLICLQDRDPTVRIAAARSLGTTEDQRMIAPLLACLQHQDARLRRAALDSLGTFNRQEMVEPLIACLQDRDKLIRLGAAEHLGRLADRRAVDPLIACLCDPSYRVRCSAAASLGLLGDARAVTPLLTCLADRDHPLRAAAAVSLGLLGDAQAVDALLTCLCDTLPLVCGAAFMALKKLANPEAIDLLDACLNTGSRTNHGQKTIGGAAASIRRLRDRREAIAFLLACFSIRDKGGYHSVSYAATRSLEELSDSSTVEPLIVHLQDPDANRRFRAVLVLGRLGERQATEPLIACLHDSDDAVRQQAARSLGELGDERAIEPLLTCLQDPNRYMREAAVSGLQEVHGHAARLINPLLACLQSQRPEVRAAAASVLGGLTDARVIEPLIACRDDQDSGVHRAASDSLRAIGKNSPELLIAHIQDENLQVRETAIDILSALGHPLVLTIALHRLYDQDVRVRAKAIDYLRKMKDPRAVEPLIACLHDQQYEIRTMAADTLGDVGEARVVEPLIACLQDQIEDVRIATASSLGSLRARQALGPLIACLQDESIPVREAAVQALGKLGDPRAIGPLTVCLQDQAKSVRQKASTILRKLKQFRW